MKILDGRTPKRFLDNKKNWVNVGPENRKLLEEFDNEKSAQGASEGTRYMYLFCLTKLAKHFKERCLVYCHCLRAPCLLLLHSRNLLPLAPVPCLLLLLHRAPAAVFLPCLRLGALLPGANLVCPFASVPLPVRRRLHRGVPLLMRNKRSLRIAGIAPLRAKRRRSKHHARKQCQNEPFHPKPPHKNRCETA